jgi:cbb3-type cytochrome oxidase maturation protein
MAAGLAGGIGHGSEFAGGGLERLAAVRPHGNDGVDLMDILYLLIPLSVVLIFFILAGLWWAIYRGQFEDIEAEGERILKND